MDASHYQTLFAYHASTFERLLDSAEHLGADDYHRQPGYALGSIHDLLLHVLGWGYTWRRFVEHGDASASLAGGEYPTLAALRAGMRSEHAAWQRWLATLGHADLGAEHMVSGSPVQLWRILQHVVLHGMQHHAEVATQLTAHGHSPRGIDFIWYTG